MSETIKDTIKEKVNDTVEQVKATATSEEPEQKKKKMIMGIAAIIVVVIIVVVACSGGDSKYIDIVRDGNLDGYSDEATIGEAFDDFFGDADWEYFVSDKDKDIVEFNGTCEFDGEDIAVTIQYEVDIDDETFEVDYFSIDDEDASLLEYAALMEAVYE